MGFENKPWRRHFTRNQVSFDRMSQNCSLDNEQYQKSHITPQDRRPDRNTSALPIATLREASDYCFEGARTKMRFPGCEGSSWTQWRHLVHPGKVRDMIKWETTLHGYPDNRNDASVTDMIGKKKWQFSTAPDRRPSGIRSSSTTRYIRPFSVSHSVAQRATTATTCPSRSDRGEQTHRTLAIGRGSSTGPGDSVP